MKQISQVVLTIFLLFSYSMTSARLLPHHQGELLVKANEINHADSSMKIQDDELFNLMGLEECDEDKDEDCIKRRMVAEAHLDYIYTQHHKPKGSP